MNNHPMPPLYKPFSSHPPSLAGTLVFLIAAASVIIVGSADAQKTADLPVPARLEITKKIHALIVKKSAATTGHSAYTELVTLAGGTKLQMLPVKGGAFLLGSPPSEVGRKPDEGPQVKVKIDPFWMSRVEITWKLYTPFYQNGKARNKDGSLMNVTGKEDLATLVCQPTPQYHDMFMNNSFVDEPDHPAMDMTHHAASKFCQWLSAQTGHYYRLPTEAEWEYACRAGTTTRWSFGDDAAELSTYAWYEDNANFTYQEVGLKKPNPWGFYDMHGNVAEWVLDQYSAKYYTSIKDGSIGPWNPPTTRYPRVARGGSWDNVPEATRSASRLGSDKGWKGKDPQVPKSVWYHTDSQHVGFRIVRPAKIPSVQEMHRLWNTDWSTPERNKEDL